MKYFLFLYVLLFLFGCNNAPDNIVLNEILTKNEFVVSDTIIIAVNHCVSPENKSYSCSTENGQTVAIGLGASISSNTPIEVSASLQLEFGNNTSKGNTQSLSFSAPKYQNVDIYQIVESYSLYKGEGLASIGKTSKLIKYSTIGKCNISILSKNTISCLDYAKDRSTSSANSHAKSNLEEIIIGKWELKSEQIGNKENPVSTAYLIFNEANTGKYQLFTDDSGNPTIKANFDYSIKGEVGFFTVTSGDIDYKAKDLPFKIEKGKLIFFTDETGKTVYNKVL